MRIDNARIPDQKAKNNKETRKVGTSRIAIELLKGNKHAGDKLSGHRSSTDPSACGRSVRTGCHRSNVSTCQ